MNIESKSSGHWTDDQLIAHLYGVDAAGGVDDRHLESCGPCKARLQGMLARRHQIIESANQVDAAFLAEQRRRIYARLSSPEHWWQAASLWRWASAGAATVALGSGLLVFSDGGFMKKPDVHVSDAQLAQEVSAIAGDTEAPPAEPLKALFE